jgi:cyclopropane-fatty-acyl-phospholipid synthase
LSTEQARLARRRIAAAGLTDRVDVRVQDYRDVEGQYDAVVSVEMIEAVGERWWPTYFRTVEKRLAPGGRAGIQAILMPHDRLLASKSSWTWIHKYIFPGGLLPSERAIDETLAQHTGLRVTDRLHFGASYAETLRRWRDRFRANAAHLSAIGFDTTFQRMWTFYLAYCEAGFRARYLDVAQLVLAAPEPARCRRRPGERLRRHRVPLGARPDARRRRGRLRRLLPRLAATRQARRRRRDLGARLRRRRRHVVPVVGR